MFTCWLGIDVCLYAHGEVVATFDGSLLDRLRSSF